MDGVQLERQAAERIGRATLIVEKSYPAPPLPRRGPRSSGSGSTGSAATRVIVVDDLPGGTPDANGTVPLSTVRTLARVLVNNNWAIDLTADFVDAYPIAPTEIEMGGKTCCGSGGSANAVGSGVAINYPLDGDARVIGTSGATFDVVGTKAPSGGSVEVTITQQGVTLQDGTTGGTAGAQTVTVGPVGSDGAWTATMTHGGMAKGPIRIEAVAKTAADVIDSTARATIHFGRGELEAAPDLFATPDTAPSLLGELTANPTVQITSAEGSDLAGPVPRVYVDGVLAFEGTSNSFPTGSGPHTIAVTLSIGGLPDGDSLVTYTLATTADPRVESGHSPPLVLSYDSTPADTTRFHRWGLLYTLPDGRREVDVLGCPIPNPDALNTKIDGAS